MVLYRRNCDYSKQFAWTYELNEDLHKRYVNNVGERSTAKNYRPLSLLSVVSKVFKKLVNNKIVDHLEKCGLFSDFQ